MIADDVLERGITAAADAYDVPEGAVERLRRQLAPADADAPSHKRRVTPKMWLGGAAAAVVGVVVLAVAVGGGSSGRSESAGGGNAPSNGVASQPEKVAPQPAPKPAEGGGGIAAGPAAGSAPLDATSQLGGAAKTPSVVPADPGSKVVKTGEMDLQVGKGQVAHTLDRLTALATLERGYVADSHSSEGADPSGSVTLRVPVQAFEATVTQVRQLPGKVVSQQTAGEDVTSKYVDLQARLRALTATRSSFERLLARATTIGDTLAVQARITDVQIQIEQLQGQLRVLDDQSSYGTLTVTVDEPTAPAPKAQHESGMSKAFHLSVSRFVHGIEAIVGIIGPLLLVVLVATTAVLVGRLGYRRLRRQLV